MMAQENGVEISNTQLYKRIKTVLKTDPIMDGSGHLYLHPDQPKPLEKLVVASVQEHTLEGLRERGISDFDGEKVKGIVAIILKYIAFPNRGKGLNRKKKTKPAKPAKKAQPQRPARAKAAVQTVTVTVKKSRTFHYPRDLPSGGDL